MAGNESCSEGGGGSDLPLSLVHRKERNEELPWSALLSQLQNRIVQLQGHLNHHFQARLPVRKSLSPFIYVQVVTSEMCLVALETAFVRPLCSSCVSIGNCVEVFNF